LTTTPLGLSRRRAFRSAEHLCQRRTRRPKKKQDGRRSPTEALAVSSGGATCDALVPGPVPRRGGPATGGGRVPNKRAAVLPTRQKRAGPRRVRVTRSISFAVCTKRFKFVSVANCAAVVSIRQRSTDSFPSTFGRARSGDVHARRPLGFGPFKPIFVSRRRREKRRSVRS